MQHINEGKPSTVPGVKTFIQQAIANLEMAHDTIIESQVVQTYHANRTGNEGKALQAGDVVYLSTVNLTMPKEQATKLISKYIEPIKVLQKNGVTDTYTLDLPEDMHKRRIHLTFHIRLLRQYEENNNILFQKRDAQEFYNVGQTDEEEWLVNEIMPHRWARNKIEFLIKWNLGDSTWEPSSGFEELEALERYLELQGVSDDDICPTGQSAWLDAPKTTADGGT